MALQDKVSTEILCEPGEARKSGNKLQDLVQLKEETSVVNNDIKVFAVEEKPANSNFPSSFKTTLPRKRKLESDCNNPMLL